MGREVPIPAEDGIYLSATVAKKLHCYLIFFVLESLIILGSLLVVVCLYLPFVALKGVLLTVTGKALPSLLSSSAPQPTRSASARSAGVSRRFGSRGAVARLIAPPSVPRRPAAADRAERHRG